MPRTAINHQDDILNFSQGAPDKPPQTKFFAYRADIGGTNQSIFEANAHTICYLKQEVNEYEAIIESVTEDMQLLNTASKMRDGMMRLSALVSMKIILPQDITKTLNNKNIFFTINSPLNIEKYENGTQAVYFYSGKYSDNYILEGHENNYKNKKQGEKIVKIMNQDNPTTFELQDVRTLDSMQNSALHFTFEERWKDFSKVNITCDNSFLLAKVKGIETKIDDPNYYEEVEFDLKISNTQKKAGLIKVIPISIKGKLTLFVESNDYESNLPWEIAKIFVAPSNLRIQIVRNDFDWQKELWRTFLSILELTNAFSTGFSAYTVQGGGSIDPDAEIGGVNISLLPSINYADAKEVIDGRIEAYTQKWPLKVDTLEFRLFKTFLNMLTPYVKCKYALGGGLNNANQIDSLFYFDLRTAVVKDMAKTDATDIEVQIKSSFFDIDTVTKELTLKEQFKKLSSYQLINANGRVSFAELPDEATALPRPAIQGDKDPNDEDITKFYCYAFFESQEKMEEAYGSKYFTSSTDENEIIRTVKSEEYYSGFKLPTPDLNKYTKDYIADNFIKPNLTPNQSIKVIPPQYDIRNIVVTTETTSVKKVNDDPFASGSSNGGYSLQDYFTVTVTISYSYTLVQTGTISQIAIGNDNTLMDKLDVELFNTYNNSDSSYKIEMELKRKEQRRTVETLSEITIEGFLGNWFELSSVSSLGGLPLDFNKPLGKMNFASKYNEKKLSTKINL